MTAAADIENLLRDLAPQALGALVRRYGEFDTCEDAVQEALLAAAVQWPRQGVPDHPKGWLITVASRRLTDQWRSDTARRRREETPPSQLALTLRAVGGLSTAEIARAFLVPEATMAQRISRAKQRIASTGARFAPPTASELPERLRVVLHVLYLIFNEGYAATSGPDAARPELTAEAIRLTRAVHRLRPDDGEIAGLLALMLLTDARRPARARPDGSLVPLAEQDRAKWNRDLMDEGLALVTGALTRTSLGPYQLQAAIAAVHAEAGTAGETDWPQILALYDLLEAMTPSPVVALNRAVAVAMVHSPQAGLGVLATLQADERMDNSHRLTAVRAHLLELAGDRDGAVAEYNLAARQTASLPERRYLEERAARLIEPPTS